MVKKSLGTILVFGFVVFGFIQFQSFKKSAPPLSLFNSDIPINIKLVYQYKTVGSSVETGNFLIKRFFEFNDSKNINSNYIYIYSEKLFRKDAR